VKEMIWGPLIAWYLFLAGAGAGAFVTSAIIEWKYPDNRKTRLAGRIIAPVFLAIGLVLLMVDAEAGLHNPLRFFGLIMNPASVMTLGVYFICVFMPVSLIVAVLDLLKKSVPKWLVVVGVIAALAVAAYTGFLLGVVKTFPLWNNAILPILFVVSALSAGMAATNLAGLFVAREQTEQMHMVKRSHAVLAVVEIVVIATMLVIVSTGSQAGAESVAALVSGQYALPFWLGLIAFGLIIPLAIEGIGSKTKSSETPSAGSAVLSAVGEVGVLTGGFLLRLLVVLAAVPITFL